ncbi:MAG: M50 family metallopeptidase [Planctomycetes bacterium]|nr:M50 family metallopeptidase [Planctomycetota bacterium]
MAFEDRDYARGSGGGGSYGGGDLGQRILRFFNYTFSVGTYLDIRVRVHITFLLLLGLYLIQDRDPLFTLQWLSVLFLSVLLHEFGHCLACRSVGGQANDILMWPLGGLAYCAPPRRPWPEFVTVIWGPLVNVLIAAASYVVLLVWFRSGTPVSLNPLQIWAAFPANLVAELLAIIFYINYVLLLFNLALIFYPFDGGRIVQIALWTKLGYGRSLSLACTFGMFGAVAIVLFGLTVGHLLLVFIGAFGFYVCYRQKAMLRQAGGYDVGFGSRHESWSTPQTGPGFFARRRMRRTETARRRTAERQRMLEAEIDRVLDKVHHQGLGSLTSKEKWILQQGTKKQKTEK